MVEAQARSRKGGLSHRIRKKANLPRYMVVHQVLGRFEALLIKLKRTKKTHGVIRWPSSAPPFAAVTRRGRRRGSTSSADWAGAMSDERAAEWLASELASALGFEDKSAAAEMAGQ